MKKTLLCTLIVAAAACAEPYDVDPNADKNPQVTIRGADAGDLAGTRDVLMRDPFLPPRTFLTNSDRNVSNFEWDGVSPVYPFNFPFIRFNKLLNGATIEGTAVDELTKRELGNCSPIPGAIEVTEDGAPVANIRTCYSPSDKLVGVQKATATGAAMTYLRYETDYAFTVTENIKDKKGRALERYTAAFTTRPFMPLVASSQSKLVTIWGAPTTGFANLPTDALPFHTRALRISFSGPMSGSAATLGLRTARLLDGNGTEVSVVDPKSGDQVTAIFTHYGKNQDETAPVTADTRTVFMYSPHSLIGDGSDGLPDGDYEIVLPTTVTDDGTVMGTKAAPVPVPLKAEVRIPFTVAEEEAE
ncbi:MAG: hypothetical protein IT381_20775 [Deltaproteobacteria bacterium]|nr:hypothetical protein [Deltaproteobacteria bacterium]